MEERFAASRRFYEAEVAPMIKEKFPAYEERIAVGIAGEGSDCFGYDDFISRDHDFGTGVCLWLTDKDMDEVGGELGQAYAQLLEKPGRSALSARLNERRGVMTIRDYYSNILGCDCDTKSGELTTREWLKIDHSCLATAVNGTVFRDDLGEFTNFRKMLLNYYPEKIWRIRIGEELHKFSSALQVNYARCMTRGDTVAAGLCKYRGIDAAMQLFFLLKREYPPYYKWTYRRLAQVDREGSFASMIGELSAKECSTSVWEGRTYHPDRLNRDDEVVIIAEKLAARIVGMLGQRGFIRDVDPYLEKYVDEVIGAR